MKCNHRKVCPLSFNISVVLAKNNTSQPPLYNVDVYECLDCHESVADFGYRIKLAGGTQFCVIGDEIKNEFNC